MAQEVATWVIDRLWKGRLGEPCLPGLTGFHGALVGFACAGADHIRLFCFAERDASSSLGELQRVGHRNVGSREGFAGKIGRACKLPRHERQPAFKNT